MKQIIHINFHEKISFENSVIKKPLDESGFANAI